jgi:ABC-type antimicrobial peptide transport system permease subunit
LEIALVGLVGGVIGALAGVSLAHYVGTAVFGVSGNDAVEITWILPFLIVFAAMAIALAGAAQPLYRTLRMEPAGILREGV